MTSESELYSFDHFYSVYVPCRIFSLKIFFGAFNTNIIIVLIIKLLIFPRFIKSGLGRALVQNEDPLNLTKTQRRGFLRRPIVLFILGNQLCGIIVRINWEEGKLAASRSINFITFATELIY